MINTCQSYWLHQREDPADRGSKETHTRTTSLWWGGGPRNRVAYQSLADSTVAIFGARSPPWKWDLIGQMGPATLDEWNWLNSKKLCYSLDPPCISHSLPGGLPANSSSLGAEDWQKRSAVKRTWRWVSYIITSRYNLSSSLPPPYYTNSAVMWGTLCLCQYTCYFTLMTSAWAANFSSSCRPDVGW